MTYFAHAGILYEITINKVNVFVSKNLIARNKTNSTKNYFLVFVFFFQLFGAKNIVKPSFDQGLECPAPKCWSKYTTCGIPVKSYD